MRKRKWLRSILVFAIAVFLASIGLSRALRTIAARRYLIAHLDASFGRPVDVARFDFSLLDGARLEAHSITVSEDPHFGNEYFMRAETLTAGLRWRALLAGRFEFGSLTLMRPSLNLARDAEGHWNIERWLPPATSALSRPGFVGPPAPRGPAARLYRIDVDDGRINFKQRDDKSPFALLDVSGSVEQDQAGRWTLDLQAKPMRAGVELQEIGMLRLRGSIAGTSARLQPAELSLVWRDVSVADALRLTRQSDYGMRGDLAIDLNARIAPVAVSPTPAEKSNGAQWSISGVARLAGIHGWRLPGRDTDPTVNVSLEANWRLGEAHAQVQKLLLEMQSSHLQSSGDLDWERGFHPQLHIASSTVALGDILAWYRAIRQDVAEDLHAEGTLGVEATIGGWPLQLQQGAIASIGGALTGPSLPATLQIGAVNASVSHGGLDFAPTGISFSTVSPELAAGTSSSGRTASNTPASTLTLRGSIFPAASGAFRWPPTWNFSIEGGTPRVQDWLALSATLAQPVNSGWTAEGGIALKMRGAHKAESPGTLWLGTMDFHGLTVSSDYVNQPVRFPSAHIEYTQLQRTVTLSAANAFGATWSGSVARKNADAQWTFDLSADHLDATELDRWLGPRARPQGLLARFTGIGAENAASSVPDTPVTRMAAHGRLRAAEVVLAPLRFAKFDGDVELAGRAITVRKAQADFFGGKVAGTFDARLVADPSYRFQGHFDGVELAQMGRAVPFLNNRIAGVASATLTLGAHGIGRGNLAASVEGDGTLNARNAELRGLDFSELVPGGRQYPSPTQLKSAQGSFHIAAGAITVTNFVLDDSQGRYRADGRVDFSHALDIRIRPSIFEVTTTAINPSPPSFLLSGTVEDPKFVLPSAEPKPAARSGTRGR